MLHNTIWCSCAWNSRRTHLVENATPCGVDFYVCISRVRLGRNQHNNPPRKGVVFDTRVRLGRNQHNNPPRKGVVFDTRVRLGRNQHNNPPRKGVVFDSPFFFRGLTPPARLSFP